MAQSIFNPDRIPTEAEKQAKKAAEGSSDSESGHSSGGGTDQPRRKKVKRKKEPKTGTLITKDIARWQNIQTKRAEEAPAAESDALLGQDEDDRDTIRILSYADAHPDHLACLVCCAEFDSIDELRKHEELSQLHQANLADPRKTKFAEACLHNIDKAPKWVKVTTAAALERRRAARRHKEMGRPKVSFTLGRKEEEVPAAAPSLSMGAALLAKAAGAQGWSAGQGLGASGEGITAPVEALGQVGSGGLGAGGQGTAGLSQRDASLKKAEERYSKLAGK